MHITYYSQRFANNMFS